MQARARRPRVKGADAAFAATCAKVLAAQRREVLRRSRVAPLDAHRAARAKAHRRLR